jgi:hypothetical protein
VGVSFWSTSPGFFGFYVDAKWTGDTGDSDDYYSNISIQEAEFWGDDLLRTEKSTIAAHIGATAVVSKRVAVYLALGKYYSGEYREYYDPMHILGSNGHYWISDDSQDKDNWSFMGGVLILMARHGSLQVGLEGAPFCVTVGMHFALPTGTQRWTSRRW